MTSNTYTYITLDSMCTCQHVTHTFLLSDVSLSDGGVCDEEEEDLAEQLKGAELIPGGGIRLRMDIPEVFYKYVIGRQGTTLRTIENDTGCRIIVPSRGRTGDVCKLVQHATLCCAKRWAVK